MFRCSPYLFKKGDEVICPSCRKHLFINRDILLSDEGKLVKCARCGAQVRYGKLQKVNSSEVEE